MRAHTLASVLTACVIATWPLSAVSEQKEEFGDYVVHYNAFTTDILQPKIARTYGIKRSKHRGLLNISVLKKVLGTTGKPVKAMISGQATNLTGQLRVLELREVPEGSAIYYLTDFAIANGETLTFKLTISPEGGDITHNVIFRQQFFTR